MLLDRLFRPRSAQIAARKLYAQVVEQSRRPALYLDLGAPDTAEGRFELYTLHLFLILERFQEGGARGKDTGQALFDLYLKGLDDALREMGVGDLSVGKKMRRLGEAFYGRVKSYRAAFAELPNPSGLEALLARTVYEDCEPGQAPQLAKYAIRQREALATQELERLLAGEAHWEAP